ncbi:hypothetical protein [Pelagicoccus sp. SDUM812002]|uniref:hypothetical protein n=1 Tax=Pelagicoccus sp. SDUM812002 TaxID=3041266 RepID=UPI00280E50E5|nr:hypothetical protein [Pelagicoccus sp. SDUM812002]MDQ8185218.1 hypothetical protein [Pelagicoccus sp. SDUM812002]
MPLILLKLAKWLLGKGIVLAVVAGLAVGVFAFWMFVEKSYSSEGNRVSELADLQERATEVYAELESAHTRLIELGEDIEETRKRIAAANQVIEYFDGILNRIERLITMSSAERAESERKLQKAKAEKASLLEDRKVFVNEQSQLRVNRISYSEEAKSLESRIGALEGESSSFVEHLEKAWLTMKPYLVVALVAAIFVPIAWKLFAFFIWAPLLSLAGPIRLVNKALPAGSLGDGGVSAKIRLAEGERIWVKESYLQASDESLRRKTRFILDWKIPATCLAAGLVEMVELTAPEGGAGQVTVSPQRRAELEVAVVEIPEGGQMVVRPSSIAGLVSRKGSPVRIERRWRLFHPQAWLTFQFRYFVFQGDCSLIVSGIRGVRFERMDTERNQGRRSNQIATIGFSPDLGYGVVRAETFWGYFRGFNPLFDDVFRGRGAFLCQEISAEEATEASRFWKGVWSGLLKVLGV